jgi:hypothetical protein
LYLVSLDITFPPGVYGAFTVYDRLPSNMRFVPTRTNPEQGWLSVRNPQRQLMEISLFRSPGDRAQRTVSFHAMKLFDGDMLDGETLISNRSATNHVWGNAR